ncbi:hypothetical protein Lal_00022998 [Lupinus albus]|nr:hypothetical protein Lal_00022998 [Lupinus albus]
MADMSNVDSKRMYSWWWDSHICPNNSKWVQQNLSIMDAKVKQMIEIIEEEADSLAQRAEMYYKKRPELMNLVEEFYRSYRALAERYDHATGMIRHAHYDLAESFPNQLHPVMKSSDDCNNFHQSSDEDISSKGLLELNEPISHHTKLFDETEEITVKNGRYEEEEEKEEEEEEEEEAEEEEEELLSEWERLNKIEAEILGLKKGVERLESEKEGGLLFEYDEERLCNIETGMADVRENCEGLEERASKAEAEVENMKEIITKLDAQKDAASLRYQHCFDKMDNLQNNNFH